MHHERSSMVESQEDFQQCGEGLTGSSYDSPYISQLIENKMLSVDQIKELCQKAKEHYDNLPNVLELRVPIAVVGDLHGQDEDLMTIFKLYGSPSYEKRFLFLGDYINRGNRSLRIILLMFAFSIEFKSSFFCLRGNHESIEIAKMYGFYGECTKTFGDAQGDLVFNEIMEACNYLPLCAIINKKLFCVHGGLSPNARSIRDIERIERRRNLPVEGLFSDLMWGDPSKKKGFYISHRGAGYLFGPDRTRKWLKKHKFQRIIRAHQVQKEGYGFTHKNMVVTVFSASNYCYRHKNKGAILVMSEEGECEFLQYYANYTSKSKPNSPASPARTDQNGATEGDQGEGEEELTIQDVSKVKLKMKLPQSKRKRKYLDKLKDFKKGSPLRREALGNLGKFSDLGKGDDGGGIVRNETPVETEFNEENAFNKIKKRLDRLNEVDGEVTGEKTTEEVEKEKDFAKQYLFNFENSIHSKVGETIEKKKDRVIEDLQDSLKKQKELARVSEKKKIELEIELERVRKQISQLQKQERRSMQRKGEERIEALEQLLRDTKEKELEELKSELKKVKEKNKKLEKKETVYRKAMENINHKKAERGSPIKRILDEEDADLGSPTVFKFKGFDFVDEDSGEEEEDEEEEEEDEDYDNIFFHFNRNFYVT